MSHRDGSSSEVEQAGDWIVNHLLSRPGVEERRSRFADKEALFVAGREFFHLDAPGLADVRLGRTIIRAHRHELKADELVELRSNSADWVNVRFSTVEEAATVVRWAEVALDAIEKH